MNDTLLEQLQQDKTPVVNPGNYSPVTVDMKDSIGAIFLGILSCLLLIGWMRASARIHALTTRLHAES